MSAIETVVDRVHAKVLDEAISLTTRSQFDRRHCVIDLVRAEAPLLAEPEVLQAVSAVLARVDGLGLLEPLFDDPTITEIMLNGDGRLWIERAGRIESTEVEVDEATVLHIIERIVAPLGLRIDRTSPVVDARLIDGSRVNAVVRPLAVDGPCLTIRRFGVANIPLSAFCSKRVEALITWAVGARLNIIVSGGTGSGKTTLVNAVAALFDRHDRVITIEDTAELVLPGEHVVRLEARPSNADGLGEHGIRDLVRNALRMRPDRIVVGEVRGSEALDMVQAMNSGHEGSLSTCHANSPVDALRRIETMVLMGNVDLPLWAIREQISASIDLVVQLVRNADGVRRIVSVDEVVGDLGDHVDGASYTTRALLDAGRLIALPRRPPRVDSSPPPDPGWIET